MGGYKKKLKDKQVRDYKKELEEKESEESEKTVEFFGKIVTGFSIAMFLWWIVFGY